MSFYMVMLSATASAGVASLILLFGCIFTQNKQVQTHFSKNYYKYERRFHICWRHNVLCLIHRHYEQQVRPTSAGTLTSSKVIPRVSEARCPMFISFRPRVIPGVSASTINPDVKHDSWANKS